MLNEHGWREALTLTRKARAMCHLQDTRRSGVNCADQGSFSSQEDASNRI